MGLHVLQALSIIVPHRFVHTWYNHKRGEEREREREGGREGEGKEHTVGIGGREPTREGRACAINCCRAVPRRIDHSSCIEEYEL